MTDPRRSTDTRTRILDAAEALFTEHGLEATSLRTITATAGVNLAAVNYHFGSKEILIEEVFRRRLTWLNEERLRQLDAHEAAAGGGPVRPRLILEAFFGPSLRMGANVKGGGRTFMRLLSRTYVEPAQFVRTFLAEEYSAVIDRFKAAFFKALPEVPREEILWRFHFMVGAFSYALSGSDALRIVDGMPLDEDPEALSARLMSFLIGGLRAPLPDVPARTARKPRAKKAA